MQIKMKSGMELAYDPEKWMISRDPLCKITGEEGEYFILENKSKDRVKIARALIISNKLIIQGDEVRLGEGLYEYHFLNPLKAAERKQMDDLFNAQIPLFFENREIVLTKSEYYLIAPSFFTSGGSMMGGFNYSLGALFESFNRDYPFYFEELCGHREMYLVKMNGSNLSGAYNAWYWSDEEHKILEFSSNDIKHGKNTSFNRTIRDFIALIDNRSRITLDYQGRAIRQLILEIQSQKAEKS